MVKEKNISLFYFNLAGIIFIIFGDHVLELLTGIPHFPKKNIIVFLFAAINIVMNKEWRKLCFSGPMLVWLILCIYADINGTIQGHIPFYSPENVLSNYGVSFSLFTMNIFSPFIVFVSTCWCYLCNRRKTLRILVFAFAIYAVLALLFDSANISAAQWTGRFGEVVGNQGSLRMFCAVFICMLAWTNKYVNSKQMITLVAVALALMLAIQTRKTLAGIFLIFIFVYLSHLKIKKVSSWIVTILGILILFVVVQFILDNTEVGARFAEVQDQGLEANETNIPILNLLGDRAIHYYLGYFVWLEHPIFGVGYANSPHYTGLPFVLHTEYWTQLVENGIIGFSLYIIFLWKLMKPFFPHFMKQDSEHVNSVICLGGLFAVMFISLTAWTYSEPHFFMMFGVIAAEGYIISKKNPIRSKYSYRKY